MLLLCQHPSRMLHRHHLISLTRTIISHPPHRTPLASRPTPFLIAPHERAPAIPATMVHVPQSTHPVPTTNDNMCTVHEQHEPDCDDAPPDGSVAMRFELHCIPPPPPGSRVLLLGSAHALGSWDVHKAVPLQYADSSIHVGAQLIQAPAQPSG